MVWLLNIMFRAHCNHVFYPLDGHITRRVCEERFSRLDKARCFVFRHELFLFARLQSLAGGKEEHKMPGQWNVLACLTFLHHNLKWLIYESHPVGMGFNDTYSGSYAMALCWRWLLWRISFLVESMTGLRNVLVGIFQAQRAAGRD